MNKINFVQIIVDQKDVTFLISEHDLIVNEKGKKIAKKVQCWNGVKDLYFDHKSIDSPWAREFMGKIHCSMWCDDVRKKTAKEVLIATLESFFTFQRSEKLYEKFEKQFNQWKTNQES